jgi:hypothetical protein
MKPFEERYTAWVDGLLEGEDREVFEREYPMLVGEREAIGKLQGLIRQQFRAPALAHPDFFNAELRKQIECDQASQVRVTGRRRWFGLPRFAWAGLSSAVAFLAVAVLMTVVPHPKKDPHDAYMAEVLKAQTNAPGVKATVDSNKNVTIIKLDGLEKVPAENELK